MNKREFPYSGDPLDLSQAEEIGEIVEQLNEVWKKGGGGNEPRAKVDSITNEISNLISLVVHRLGLFAFFPSSRARSYT